jgi:dienelactone hydrolase
MTQRSPAFWIAAYLLIAGGIPSVAMAQEKTGGEVQWLKSVTTPVQIDVPKDLGRLDPILVIPSGEILSHLTEWKTYRKNLRQRWLEFLGPMPEPRPQLSLEILTDEVRESVRRQLVQYQGEPGMQVQGYLLRPELSPDSGKLPGIVALHQTTNSSIDEIAGVSGRDAMHLGFKLAKRGFIVFCPRCFLWQDVSSLNEAVEQHRRRHPQSLGMAKMLYDAMRATDVLLSVPDIDPDRIGTIGHSLGAKEVLYLTAFDERIHVGVASEGGLGFRSTNWDAPWYLGEAIRDPQFALNHHQLLALIAPRPFLILGGESGPGAADGDRSWPLITAALPAWKLYGGPTRLGLLNHHEGHSVSPKSFDAMAEWLETYLQPRHRTARN